MTRLRKHLEAARSEYEAVQYPGDLSRDLLMKSRANAQPETYGFIGRAARVGIAIAALVMIALVGRHMLQSEPSSVATTQTDEPTTQATDESLPSFAAISVPSWTEVTEVASVSTKDQASQTTNWPSMPSFPSLDQIDASSATKSLNSSSDEEIQ